MCALPSYNGQIGDTLTPELDEEAQNLLNQALELALGDLVVVRTCPFPPQPDCIYRVVEALPRNFYRIRKILGPHLVHILHITDLLPANAFNPFLPPIFSSHH